MKMLKFKKINLLLTAALLGSMLLGGSGLAHADTQLDPSNTTADAFINLTAPTLDALRLTSVPSFDFGDATIQTSQIVLNAVGVGNYSVLNLTGNNKGYTIQTKIGNFTGVDANNQPISLTVDHFYLSVANNTSNTMIGNTQVDINNIAATVLTGTANADGNQTSGEVDAQMIMNTTLGQLITPGQYGATINHSLVAGV
jgi:hypothetical protein